MAAQQDGKPAPSKIVGTISELVGVLVGTIAAFGRKITDFWVEKTEESRPAVLSTRLAALEADLTAIRKELEKISSRENHPEKHPKPKRTKLTTQEEGANQSQDGPKSEASAETIVAIQSQEQQPSVAEVKTSGDNPGVAATTTAAPS